MSLSSTAKVLHHRSWLASVLILSFLALGSVLYTRRHQRSCIFELEPRCLLWYPTDVFGCVGTFFSFGFYHSFVTRWLLSRSVVGAHSIVYRHCGFGVPTGLFSSVFSYRAIVEPLIYRIKCLQVFFIVYVLTFLPPRFSRVFRSWLLMCFTDRHGV